jgi:hypothetical protein
MIIGSFDGNPGPIDGPQQRQREAQIFGEHFTVFGKNCVHQST